MRDFFDTSSEFAKLLHRKLNTVKNFEKIDFDINEIKIFQLRIKDMLLSNETSTKLYKVQTSKIQVMINDRKQYALINIDAEICMINFKTTQKCELSIRMNSQVHVIETTNHSTRFREVCENVKMNIKEVVIKIFIFVAEKFDQKLLLEIYFERKFRIIIQFLNDESVTYEQGLIIAIS